VFKIIFYVILGVSLFNVPTVFGALYYPNYQGAWDHPPVICIKFEQKNEQYKYDVLAGITAWKKALRDYYKDNRFDFEIYSYHHKKCDVLMWFDNNSPLRLTGDTAAGATQCKANHGILQSCFVEISTRNTPNQAMKNVVTHEIGHVWGFGHLITDKTREYPAAVLTSDIMLNGVSKLTKITACVLEAFEQKYSDDGWNGTNNYTTNNFYVTKCL
jgi:hypothetical protein